MKRVSGGSVVCHPWFALGSIWLWLVVSAVAQDTRGLLREVYSDLAGSTLADLTNSPAYPAYPSNESLVQGGFESPTDFAENYGQRLSGLLTPPVTGDYVFWISSDDAGGLFLSTDDDPAHLRQIAWVNSWTPLRTWDWEANQQSAPIRLVAGQRYSIEALHKEATGGDSLAVRWRLPDGSVEEPIPASRLSMRNLGLPVFLQQPGDVTVIEGERVSFSALVRHSLGATFQWQRDGIVLAGATNRVLTIESARLGESGARFRCAVTNAWGGVWSAAATLTVRPDRVPPTVTSVVCLGDLRFLTVRFSEAIEEQSALAPAHYAIDKDVSVLSVRVAADSDSVVLETSGLAAGIDYTLAVGGVNDRAATSNKIADGTRIPFRVQVSPLEIGALRPVPEPLGPSNRRRGVVVSEIMFHPAARRDGRNAQFLELFNSYDWPQDLSGWRLTGAVDYTFPAGTTLSARGFLVVTPRLADFQAIYGGIPALEGVALLPRDQGRVRLRNANGVVVFDTEYAATFHPAVDGAGHSLVLARPSYGEAQPEAWAASERVGGSPGASEPERSTAYRTVLINEVLAQGQAGQADYVELFNYGSERVNLTGCVLTDDPATNRFVFPTGTTIPALGYLSLDRNQLGFGLDAEGEALYLFAPDRTRIVEAVRFGPQSSGIAFGRTPDGAATWRALEYPTPGTGNRGPWISPVVINEIMYEALGGDPDDEYVELYNRGDGDVDLSSWRFVAGVDYVFSSGTTLPAGGYLVVARNRNRLLATYPQLNAGNAVGDYQGSLANAGERLALARPRKSEPNDHPGAGAYVVVNEVAWGTGGCWPSPANGGGSSLELTDPRADNAWASHWAASDESTRSQWTTVEATGVLDHGNGDYPPDQLQILLLGEGECLVDRVEVLRAGGPNLVANPAFAAGLSHWVAQGNHSGSSLEPRGGAEGGPCLRLRAQGRGDTGPNRIRTAIAGLSPGDTVTLRARVRWLSGWPEILLRLRGNWLEAAGVLAVARPAGTPGQVNSRFTANAGPAIAGVTHDPPLPAAGQAVTVRARVNDPDGLASLLLYYRVDPASAYTAVPLVYRGAGLYSATLPGLPAGGRYAFYLQARDLGTPAATSRFPSDAPERECLVQFGEPTPAGGLGVYHLWLADRTVKTWAAREKLSSAPLDGTFVYGNSRVIYNIGATYSGSPWVVPAYDSPVGTLCGYALRFPADDRCLSETDFSLDFLGGVGTTRFEHVALWLFEQLGVFGGQRRFVHLYVNGAHRGTVYQDCVQPNSDVIAGQFPEDTQGDLYKIDDWFEFDDGGSRARNVNATLEAFTTSGGVKKTARYRWNWRKRAVAGSASDYASLFALVDAINPKDAAQFTDAEFAALAGQADLDQWARVFAVERLVANWDSYGYDRGKNMYAYKPRRGKWVLWPWDIDVAFDTSGYGYSSSLFGGNDPTIVRLLNQPCACRLYLRALWRAVQGPLTPTRVNAFIDAYDAGLRANGVDLGTADVCKDWIARRRAFLLEQLAPYDVPFAIVSPNAATWQTAAATVTLVGTAPLSVSRIYVNDVEYPVTWTTPSQWSIVFGLRSGRNALTLTGGDNTGASCAGAQATLTVECTGLGGDEPAIYPYRQVRINEWMAANTRTGRDPLTGGYEDWFELYNAGATAVDLSGFTLTDDLARPDKCVIPTGVSLPPFAYLLAWADERCAMGGERELHVNFKLNQAGEGIGLFTPGGVAVDTVSFGPQTADVSQGRFPDGQGEPTATFPAPTPAQANLLPGRAGWQYASVTAALSTSGSLVCLSLLEPGDAYVDDLRLVAGSNAAVGANLLANGDFEQGTGSAWLVMPDYSESSLASNVYHAGRVSLRLVATHVGTNASSSVWQRLLPPLKANSTYTLSGWYRSGARSNRLALRLWGTPLEMTHELVSPLAAAPRLLPPTLEPGRGWRLTWEADPGGRYQVQTTSHLAAEPWTDLGAALTATGSRATQLDPARGDSSRYYRVLRLDTP